MRRDRPCVHVPSLSVLVSERPFAQLFCFPVSPHCIYVDIFAMWFALTIAAIGMNLGVVLS